MARDFAQNTTDRVVVADHSAIDLPTVGTVAIWAWADTYGTPAQNTLLKKDGNYLLRRDTVANNLRFYFWDGSGIRFSAATQASTGAWHHYAATISGTDIGALYVDGASAGSAPADFSTTGGQTLTNSLGIGNDPSVTETWDGRLAEAAIWSRALSAAEIAGLAKGYPPISYPNSLELYMPLMGRQSPEPNWITGNTGTVTGTVNVAHPPVMPPYAWVMNRGVFVPAAAGGAVRRRNLLGVGY